MTATMTAQDGTTFTLSSYAKMQDIGRCYALSNNEGAFIYAGRKYKATDAQFEDLGFALYAIHIGHYKGVMVPEPTAEEAFAIWVTSVAQMQPMRRLVGREGVFLVPGTTPARSIHTEAWVKRKERLYTSGPMYVGFLLPGDYAEVACDPSNEGATHVVQFMPE